MAKKRVTWDLGEVASKQMQRMADVHAREVATLKAEVKRLLFAAEQAHVLGGMEAMRLADDADAQYRVMKGEAARARAMVAAMEEERDDRVTQSAQELAAAHGAIGALYVLLRARGGA